MSLIWKFDEQLNDDQLFYLKDILIPGLPDFEWTVEYGAYLNDPTNDAKKMAVV